jgi:hypothetical protein
MQSALASAPQSAARRLSFRPEPLLLCTAPLRTDSERRNTGPRDTDVPRRTNDPTPHSLPLPLCSVFVGPLRSRCDGMSMHSSSARAEKTEGKKQTGQPAQQRSAPHGGGNRRQGGRENGCGCAWNDGVCAWRVWRRVPGVLLAAVGRKIGPFQSGSTAARPGNNAKKRRVAAGDIARKGMMDTLAQNTVAPVGARLRDGCGRERRPLETAGIGRRGGVADTVAHSARHCLCMPDAGGRLLLSSPQPP